MPIKNINNTQLLFGVGDISVQIGYKRFTGPGAIQFVKVDPLPVDVSAEIETNEKVKIDEALVTFIFNQIESLYKVISQFKAF
ncbi:hypothetical protein ACQKMV_21390 [Lysinibacillus sp. NPDC094403]|uniref:hypothetical protein n=1 Tax=Lysinibacillus sp. NPDC094403 TaxID=3390581 RepID=UPI003D019468